MKKLYDIADIPLPSGEAGDLEKLSLAPIFYKMLIDVTKDIEK